MDGRDEAHKLWLKQKQHILDEMTTAMIDLGAFNMVAESHRVSEIIDTMKKARDFIKQGEI